ncbi:hypothetical protein ASN18_1159 [Candidatus Magnetominusculus xianensis]|uniref:Uncharacterized protein n=1 Tax=Candidatus Magnetominusculus xianensis TaxID=1748249 RepID=A0ABR5SL17_9BACT|nr:hypothetical protein ASN18_1159 [Candidatus Magnetominusculus xianensis]
MEKVLLVIGLISLNLYAVGSNVLLLTIHRHFDSNGSLAVITGLGVVSISSTLFIPLCSLFFDNNYNLNIQRLSNLDSLIVGIAGRELFSPLPAPVVFSLRNSFKKSHLNRITSWCTAGLKA